jgi:predicted PurR-regulated permease PerM
MTVSEVALTVIAVCMVLITLGTIVISIALYKLLKKLEESVDTVNNQLRPAILELKKTILNVTEAFQIVEGFVSSVKKFKRKKERKEEK